MSIFDRIAPDAGPGVTRMSSAQFLATVSGDKTVLPQNCPPGHYVVTIERDGRESGLSHIAPVDTLRLRMRAVMDSVDRHRRARSRPASVSANDNGSDNDNDNDARIAFVTQFLAPMLLDGERPDCAAGRSFGAQLIEFYIFERILEAGCDPADFFKEGAGVFLDIKTRDGCLSETLYLQQLAISRVN